jgi:MFS transporter, NNP family, nitrate/nitrite transporter
VSVTVANAQESPQSLRSLRTALTLVVATIGLGLNLRAWILLAPHLHERFDLDAGRYVILLGLPLLVAAVIRLPLGVLTDRYGARVMFPAVSLAAAVCVVALGLAESLTVAVIAGGAAGVAGGAFVVGATHLSRMFPYGRRGLVLGVFTLGPAVAVLFSAISREVDPAGRGAAAALAAALVVVAGLAAAVFRDPPRPQHAPPLLRRCAEMVRVASTTSLSVLYGLALGGLTAASLYLPLYLAGAFRLGWFTALAVTGVVVILSALGRLGGGWWTDRRPTVRLLVGCYSVAAGLCLVEAVAPRVWWLAGVVIAAIAVCDGLASGALLALISKAARADSVGSVMGVTGAVAALGALLPPLLLAGMNRLSHGYSAAWVLLAALLCGAALYVRSHGLRVGLGLAVQFQPEPTATTMTVAVVGESEIDVGAAPVVARLAELASTDELVVVFGTTDPTQPRLNANVLVAGLRDRLPRHSVVALRATPRSAGLDQLAAVLDELLEAGTVTIAVTPTADLHDVAVQLASHLQADRIVAVTYSPAAGADLHEVWKRESTPVRTPDH